MNDVRTARKRREEKSKVRKSRGIRVKKREELGEKRRNGQVSQSGRETKQSRVSTCPLPVTVGVPNLQFSCRANCEPPKLGGG